MRDFADTSFQKTFKQENLKLFMKKRVKAIIKRGKEIHGMRRILFNRPLTKFVLLILVYVVLSNILKYYPKIYKVRLPIVFIEILIAIYFIIVMGYMVKGFIDHLLKPKNLLSLIGAYALFLFGILFIFATVFNIVELTGRGYIRYGGCTSDFNNQMIGTDNLISRDFFYFSAVTFFTVGYGDICPMGAARLVSIIAAFTGHIVSVLIVGLIINNYITLRRSGG